MPGILKFKLKKYNINLNEEVAKTENNHTIFKNIGEFRHIGRPDFTSNTHR